MSIWGLGISCVLTLFLLSGGDVLAQKQALEDSVHTAPATADTLPSLFLSGNSSFYQLYAPGDSLHSIFPMPFRLTGTSPAGQDIGISDSTDNVMLEKLREAFGAVVSGKSDSSATVADTARANKALIAEHDKTTGLNLGGLVLDETMTRMGRNFYSIFYQIWDDPSGVGNFMITVNEQPIPSMGSIVSIEIDDRRVYRQRLQPRYYQIKQQAQQAVQICQRALQAIKASQSQITGYQP